MKQNSATPINKTRIRSFILEDFLFYGATALDAQIDLWCAELSDLSADEVHAAILALRKDPKKMRPSFPAQIRDKVFGYISAEEAWTLVPLDEKKSVVWSQEVATAFGIVRGMVKVGDFVGARLAFIKAYEAEVEKSRAARLRPKWWASMGQNPEGRDEALLDAVEKNRLTPLQALSYNSQLDLPEQTRLQIASNVKMLAAPEAEYKPMTDEERQKGLENVQKLLAELNSKKAMPEHET